MWINVPDQKKVIARYGADAQAMIHMEECAELIQAASKKIYQIAVDYNGNIFSSINRIPPWNGDFLVEQKKTADGWSLMLSVPIKPLGFTGAPTDAGRIMFVRYWDNRTKGFCCWESGAIHDPADFGTLNFL